MGLVIMLKLKMFKIVIERYTLPRWENLEWKCKTQSWLKVEIAACKANCSLGNIHEEALKEIQLKAKFEESELKKLKSKTWCL